MANLTEISEWTDGIYQLERTDKVDGGSSGIHNLPLKQLVNRTSYLKERLAMVEGMVQGAYYAASSLTDHLNNNFYTKVQSHQEFMSKDGRELKTINGESLVGDGDITIRTEFTRDYLISILGCDPCVNISVTGSGTNVIAGESSVLTFVSTISPSNYQISMYKLTLPDNSVVEIPSQSLTQTYSYATTSTSPTTVLNFSVISVSNNGVESQPSPFSIQVTERPSVVAQFIRYTIPNCGSNLTAGRNFDLSIFQGSTATESPVSPYSYSIENISPTNSIQFSKVSGVIPNENVVMTVPPETNGSVSFNIVLIDANSSRHVKNVSLQFSVGYVPISSGGINEFTVAGSGSWNVPTTGDYEIILIGGGGAGGAGSGPVDPTGHSSGGGGGSGFPIREVRTLTAGTSIAYRVGRGGVSRALFPGEDGESSIFGDIVAQGGKGGGLPTHNGSGAPGGDGWSGGGAGSISGESNPPGGDGGSDGSDGQDEYSNIAFGGNGSGSTLSSLGITDLVAGVGGRSLPPPGIVHTTNPDYPQIGVGEGGSGFGAGGGGSGTCGSANPGYGGGGGGGINPSSGNVQYSGCGERAPGSHISSRGGDGAQGYIRVRKL